MNVQTAGSNAEAIEKLVALGITILYAAYLIRVILDREPAVRAWLVLPDRAPAGPSDAEFAAVHERAREITREAALDAS